MILDDIAADTRLRVAGAKERVSMEEMMDRALSMNAKTGFPVEQELKREGIHLSLIHI